MSHQREGGTLTFFILPKNNTPGDMSHVFSSARYPQGVEIHREIKSQYELTVNRQGVGVAPFNSLILILIW